MRVAIQSLPDSPGRCRGGCSAWLIPRIRQWLASIKKKPTTFIEPFAGGAIVGLTVAFEKHAEHVILVELDKQVAAVWQTILGGEAEWLANRILNFDLTQTSVQEILASETSDIREKAFGSSLFHVGRAKMSIIHFAEEECPWIRNPYLPLPLV
ncbi:MAG: DNA adenine methylase [Magnetococcales bacterium]|nr:DNA adenine methylase [Magnetococcales bacterium]